jgi:hypothetical protein
MSNVAIVSVESFTSTLGPLDRVFEPYTLANKPARGFRPVRKQAPARHGKSFLH